MQSVTAVASFNEEVKLEMKQDGFLGEPTDRYDTIHRGYGGDMEFQVNRHTWETVFLAAVERRARREEFVEFNVIRTDRYSNGQNVIATYKNVAWGAFPRSLPSRGDHVKIKTTFGCSERSIQVV